MDEMDDGVLEEPKKGKYAPKNKLLKSYPVSGVTLGAGVLGALAIGSISPPLGGIAFAAAASAAFASGLVENSLKNDDDDEYN